MILAPRPGILRHFMDFFSPSRRMTRQYWNFDQNGDSIVPILHVLHVQMTNILVLLMAGPLIAWCVHTKCNEWNNR
jgi:hypothetical protein